MYGDGDHREPMKLPACSLWIIKTYVPHPILETVEQSLQAIPFYTYPVRAFFLWILSFIDLFVDFDIFDLLLTTFYSCVGLFLPRRLVARYSYQCLSKTAPTQWQTDVSRPLPCSHALSPNWTQR